MDFKIPGIIWLIWGIGILFNLTILGFIGWVIIMVMRHFGVI